jgi:hypothetical protein
MVDVGAMANVEVGVSVGVRVGDSGVKVKVNAAKVGDEIGGTALCDTPTINVCAMDVPTAFGSGVDIAGTAHATIVPMRAATDK